jgi:two-component system cell cycle sensor histidine kinase/response regulator CckA
VTVGGSLLERNFRQTLENVSLVALALDPQGRVTFANDFLLDLTGWAREEVLGGDWFSIFLPDEVAESIRETFDLVATEGRIPAHYQNEIVTRGGERRMISFSNVVHFDENGSPAGLISIGEDVTDRLRADEVLRDREEFFRSLIENLYDVITVIAPDGTSIFESPSVERVLGWKPEEIVGGPRYSHLHPDDVPLMEATVDAIRAGETRGPIEIRLQHRDGTWRTVESVGRLFRQDGEDVVIVNYRDVTEQLRLREQLLDAQKLEAIGRLAGGIAHDFNNILTTIVGYSEFLAASFAEDDPRRDETGEIAHAAGRAATLTAQLLAFSRRQVVLAEVLDLSEVVAVLEGTLARLVGAEVELVTELQAGSWVRADRGQLGLVVTNLVVNAFDAMPGGGKIELVVASEDGEVALTVRDDGVGMDADTLAHVFEPFFTTKEASQGAGLGLATVYGIVAQMGGEVSVTSAPAEGASFRVVLPHAGEVAAPIVSAESKPALPAGAGTVLVAEDEDMIRRLVTEVLTRQGYSVLAAATGAEALELLETHVDGVDLLLTDMLMPGMSGSDLYRAVSASHPSVRVLFTSGYTNEPQEVLDDPAVAFIGKPFTTNALAAKVREVLEADPPRPSN